MPLYDWKCEGCGKQREVLRSVADCRIPEFCECGIPMIRQLTAAYVQGDIAPYMAVAGDRAGKYITSRKEHRQFLKRNRLVEIGDAPVKSTKQMRKTVTRKEIREELKKVIPEALRNDRKRKRA